LKRRACFQKGLILMRIGKYKDAIEEYRKVLSLSSENDRFALTSYYNMGLIYEEMGLLDEAKKSFEGVFNLPTKISLTEKRKLFNNAYSHLKNILKKRLIDN
jgi:tetratricopeptide (TPR) repeat protein